MFAYDTAFSRFAEHKLPGNWFAVLLENALTPAGGDGGTARVPAICRAAASPGWEERQRSTTDELPPQRATAAANAGLSRALESKSK